jgi:hypothetical protein
MIKRYNITTCKTYQSQGQEKKYWPNVGQLTYFPAYQDKPEGYRLELNMFPELKLFVFEQKPQGTDAEPRTEIDADTRAVRTARADSKGMAAVAAKGRKPIGDQIEYPTEEIDPDSIPF